MIPIIDAHHHIWRQADLAWLNGPMQPRIFGPYESIMRDYPIDEFKDDLKGTGVVASVYCQTNWPVGQDVDEVAWVQSVADQSGWPQAITGYADLLNPDVGEVLKVQSQYANLRAIRMQLHWHENKHYRFQPTPDLMNDPLFRKNLSLLQDYGWIFELQVFPSQFEDSAQLAADFPDIDFVLLHAGMLISNDDAVRGPWRDGLKRLADQPNVYTKLSALGTFINANSVDHITDVALETIDIFGHERCVFGSNFPIEKLWTTYTDIVDAYRQALSGLPEEQQRAIFFENAKRLYKIDIND